MQSLLAACAVLVKPALNPEFSLLVVEPTITMQPPICAAEVWFKPNPGFGQHVVEQVVMTPHLGKYFKTCHLHDNRKARK